MPGNSLWLTDGGLATLPAFPDELTGPREESWRWELLSLDDEPLGTLDGVTGGDLEFSIHNTIRGGGRLAWSGSSLVDWNQVRVQPWYSLTSHRGSLSWPLGVFLPAAPATRWRDRLATADVELYDKLLVLDQYHVEETTVIGEGAKVTDWVRSLVESTPGAGSRVVVEDSDEYLRSARVWEAGTSHLRIVNDLLAAVNYFSLRVDGTGTFRADPYTPPSTRGLAWPFLDDRHSLYLPEFTHERDTFNVPNKITVISTSDGDTPALTSTVTNDDPASPVSIPSRGREISRTIPGVEATSQEVLDGIAARYLAEATQTASSVELRHAMLPLDLNNRVRFRREPAGLDLYAVVQSMHVRTGLGAQVTSTLREVVS